MPRQRLRLATLALLIVIATLATALFVHRRRETALKSLARALVAENQVLATESARDRRVLERIQVSRLRQLDELRAQVARLSGQIKDAIRDSPTDHREAGAPEN